MCLWPWVGWQYYSLSWRHYLQEIMISLYSGGWRYRAGNDIKLWKARKLLSLLDSITKPYCMYTEPSVLCVTCVVCNNLSWLGCLKTFIDLQIFISVSTQILQTWLWRRFILHLAGNHLHVTTGSAYLLPVTILQCNTLRTNLFDLVHDYRLYNLLSSDALLFKPSRQLHSNAISFMSSSSSFSLNTSYLLQTLQ